MRRCLLTLGLLAVLLGTGARAAGATAPGALQTLRAALQRDMRQIGGRGGAFVVDLNTGAALFGENATVARLPASLQKLYTTTAILERFGPAARLSTSVWGRGRLGARGVLHGTLYLRGGGDPTFGSAGFDRAAYAGSGATMERLVSTLIRETGITRVDGAIVGDASYFDSLRGTAESDYRPDIYMTGELSGLAFDRGFANFSGTEYQPHPVLYAAQAFASALRAAGVHVPRSTAVRTGRTPMADVRLLADVRSPPMAKLVELTNTPSDNFLAEMLLKDLGARFGGAGTTVAGVGVARAELLDGFDLRPRFDDGSGLSYADSTTPRQVVRLLRTMATNAVFRQSLAVGGRTGTLEHEMRGTAAQGRCQGKTGTLHSVANLAGYCLARDGHTLAFAVLASSVANPDHAHLIEGNRIAPALASYDG